MTAGTAAPGVEVVSDPKRGGERQLDRVDVAEAKEPSHHERQLGLNAVPILAAQVPDPRASWDRAVSPAEFTSPMPVGPS